VHPQTLTPEAHERLKKRLGATISSVSNQHRTALLEEGLKFEPIAVPNKDAQWIESRQFMVSELCRWLRIPPHKIGHLIDATYSKH